MKRSFILFGILVVIASCNNVIEKIIDASTIQRSCWLDTRTLTIHYKCRRDVESVGVFLYETKERITYIPRKRRNFSIGLDSLRSKIIGQPITISINLVNEAARESQDIDVSKQIGKKREGSTQHIHIVNVCSEMYKPVDHRELQNWQSAKPLTLFPLLISK